MQTKFLFVAASFLLVFVVSAVSADVIYLNDFEDTADPLAEWSYTPTDITPGTVQHPSDRFLGPFGSSGQDTDNVTLTLNIPHPHNSVSVSFDLYCMGSWDGNGDYVHQGQETGPDIWYLTVNGGPVLLHTTFSNEDSYNHQAYPDSYPGGINPAGTGASEIDTLGISYQLLGDSVYHLCFTFQHSANTLVLEFSSSLMVSNPTNDEIWGLDNVKVEVIPEPVCTFSDDFEDGVIDTGLWVIGGAKRGAYPSDPIGVGGWSYSHEEIPDAADGYLQMRVWGPTSGYTYGAEAWVRTTYNFNDGKDHIINFTWEAELAENHYNHYLVQITDGYIPDPESLHWPLNEQLGTTDLLWGIHGVYGTPTRGRLLMYYPSGLPKATWSITISPAGIARLYDGPNATGSLLHEGSLDAGKPWYVRFMVSDGTSAGFPSGDARLNLYDFSAVCEPTEPNIAVSPLSHDFGDVELGTSSTVVVTISNVGDGNLNVSGIALETDFAITSAPATAVIVEPNKTVDVEITYTPTVLGDNSAVLKITSDDPDEPVVEVQLSATGVEIPPPPSEQIANILAFFNTSVDGGTLVGDGPGNSAEKRLNALRNMIEAAGDLIDDELSEEACQQLLDVYRRMDGQPKPPDFVKGEAVPELAAMIQELMTSLGCE